MSILLDHLPTNFDVAFKRALETLDPTSDHNVPLNNSKEKHPASDEKEEPRRPSFQDKVFESVAEIGLKGTTERSGGEGNVLGHGKETR